MSNEVENKEWKNTGCLKVIGVFFIIVIIIWLGAVSIKQNKNTSDACEDLNGTYQVVGREFSAAHKTTIDVYGCVK